MEGIRVLHQELARAHHAKARPDLVAELGLDLVQVQRQLTVAFHLTAHQVGDDLLVGRAEAELALVPVLDLEHLRAEQRPAASLLPQFGGLHRRHQQFVGAGAVHLLADDALDLAQHAQAQRHPGVEARAEAADQTGAEHQLVRDQFGFVGRFLERGDKELRAAHGDTSGRAKTRILGAFEPVRRLLERANGVVWTAARAWPGHRGERA